MKAGLTTSAVLHAAILGIGLVSLSGPKPLDAGASEALPVSIVPIEEMTQMIEGDKTAALSETPAPTPTTRPPVIPEAQNAGDNDKDLATPPTPMPTPREVKAASAPPPSEPTPAPEPTPPTPEPPPPAPTPEPVAETPPPELAPPEETTPEPVPEQAVTEAPKPEAEAVLPDSAPAPAARPKPVETKVAEAKPVEKKAAEKPAEKPAEKKSAQKSDSTEKSLEDEVAMLLDKQKPSGGGAKRSTQTASLGGKKTTGAKLSQGEMDALRGQLISCWSIPAGMENGEGLRVSVRFNLDASGKLDGRPEVTTSSGNAVFDRSALTAIRKCDNRGFVLPPDKADTWSEVVVNFDPSEMF
ncbi:MAG: hypothetical protein DI629_14865 [Mesorhizobium amorphae]|nr:MAG: hypothetical protein DI629_14865 [Mesorhizobium amorphae]